jgi:hypothetical protein
MELENLEFRSVVQVTCELPGHHLQVPTTVTVSAEPTAVTVQDS